jgi:general secretion pathway protein A
VAGDFGLPVAGKNKSELLLVLSNFVISRHQKKLTTVLVVDEAHHVSTEVLEEIRLLTNLETTNEKLLQILLVGQPELDEKLDSVELRQLKQRIALRSQLQPLDLDETKGYIQRRLQLAGSTSTDLLFPADTIARIHRHTRGFPRLINTVCENALITAYARQSLSVTPDIIEDIATDFRLGVVHQPKLEAAGGNEDGDARRAAKTLLLLHDYLQKLQSSQGEPRAAAIAGTGKHEPYI